MTMHKAFPSRDDVTDYVSRREKGRELAGIQDSFDVSYNDSKTA